MNLWTKILLFVTVWAFSSPLLAQPLGDRWTSLARPVQGTARFLGFGFSRGYHQGSPGPDSSYFNPHTVQNSQRIAQGTEHVFPERKSRSNPEIAPPSWTPDYSGNSPALPQWPKTPHDFRPQSILDREAEELWLGAGAMGPGFASPPGKSHLPPATALQVTPSGSHRNNYNRF
jgi:hypothetical protein